MSENGEGFVPLTLRDASKEFRIPLSTLRGEVIRGKLPTFQIGNRAFTTAADVKQIVKRRRAEAKARECRRHANACGRKARKERDRSLSRFWRERERVWANLAYSYTLSARISLQADSTSHDEPEMMDPWERLKADLREAQLGR
jgi:tellurite resistance protein